MGLLDNLVSGVMKTVLNEVEAQALPGLLSKVLANTDLGSIGGLLAKLQEGGLDRQVASWLGNGANMHVSGDDLKSALGSDALRQIAQQMGVPLDGLLGMLAKQLPGMIDGMSPNGTLEEGPAEDSGSEESSAGTAGGSLADEAGLRDIKR